MDIETLTKAIELIRSLGGDAKEAFIWWLIVGNAHYYLFGLIWSAIGGITIFKLIHIFLTHNESFRYLERLRRATQVSCYWSEDEIAIAAKTLAKYYQQVKMEHKE